jgi:hypothetical protein
MKVTATITSGTLTTGQRVEGQKVGKSFRSTWSGIYDGQRPSEHDGVMCHYFRDGDINGIAQGLHGFPVSQMEV